MTSKEKIIITDFESKEQFLSALKYNPGLIIIKFGAKWCGPCAQIHDLVYQNFYRLPDEALCADIDIDNNFDIYSFLKSKRMINGIPAIFCYVKGNESYIPDDMVIGADPEQVTLFFNRCLESFK